MVSKEQEQKILEETKMLVELFLKTNLSDLELAEKTGISSSTVGRRLTNKDNIMRLYPNNGESIYEQIITNRQNNLQRGKVLGGQTSILNNRVIKDENGKFIENIPKLRLDLIYRNPHKQMQLLRHIALTFRAKSKLLAELFGIDEEYILENFYNASNNRGTIYYLEYIDFSDQENAKVKVIEFYRDLINAIKNKDKGIILYLIRSVSDYKALQILNNHKPGDRITEEDFEVIVKYQLKYSFTQKIVSELFKINLGHYVERVNNYVNCHPELKEQYNTLSEYNYSLHWRSINGKNK